MNPLYLVIGRKIYEQTDQQDVYCLVEKCKEKRFTNNLNIDTLRYQGAIEFKTFGEARRAADI